MIFAPRNRRTLFAGAATVAVLSSAMLAFRPPASSAFAPGSASLHYAPSDNLEHIDVALIDQATKTIDVAAYLLTDWPIMQAMARAADRNVRVRIVLDHSELRVDRAVRMLQGRQGVVIRVKSGHTLMHLKAYAIDGHTLRTGSANLSSADAAAAFVRKFEVLWSEAYPIDEALNQTNPPGYIPHFR